MRIWIVNHYATTPDEPGGTRHFTLARELAARGHEVTIFASSFSHNLKRETRLAPGEAFRREQVEGVAFVWVRTKAYAGNTLARFWNMVSFALRLWRGAGQEGLQPPDLILGSSPHLFAALAAERMAKRMGVPFVMEVRDIWPQTLVDLGRISPRHPMIRLMDRIERHLYRKARRIVTLLPSAHEHFEAQGGKRASVVWVPNGVDLGLFPPPSRPASAQVLTVLYAGAHGLANGLHQILDAAKLVEAEGGDPWVRFLFVGDGPEKAALVARAEAEGLSCVTFLPPVPKAEVSKLMAGADAFFMVLMDSPLFRWGISPNKLFDYLASARPVLFGVTTPFNPVAEHRAGFTIQASDPRSILDALKQLRDLPSEERWLMGLRGRAYVETNHDFKGLALKLESALLEVLGEPRP